MGRLDPAERRRQLVEAAFDVLVERGEQTRISDIAARARVAPGLVTYYFPNKDDLLLEATRFGIDRFVSMRLAALARVQDPWERLEQAVHLAMPSDDRDSAWILLMQFWTRSIHRPTLQTVAAMFQTRSRDLYTSIIEAGTASGRFAPVDSSEAIASGIIAMIDGLAIRIILRDPAIDVPEMERIVIAFARQTVGVRPEAAAS